MQVLFAIASSSLEWTGSNTFSMVGCSLGASITMTFADKFPNLVDSIVLLGPAGLIRRSPEGYNSFFIHNPALAPSFDFMGNLVGQVLGVEVRKVPKPDIGITGPHRSRHPTSAAAVVDYKHMDIPAIVQWQYDNHQGFIHSFANTIRHGPPMGQLKTWRRVCDVIRGETCPSSKLHNSRILVFFGDADNVVVGDEVADDLIKILGAEHVVFRYLPEGHGFQYRNSEEIVSCLAAFWNLR